MFNKLNLFILILTLSGCGWIESTSKEPSKTKKPEGEYKYKSVEHEYLNSPHYSVHEIQRNEFYRIKSKDVNYNNDSGIKPIKLFR